MVMQSKRDRGWKLDRLQTQEAMIQGKGKKGGREPPLWKRLRVCLKVIHPDSSGYLIGRTSQWSIKDPSPFLINEVTEKLMPRVQKGRIAGSQGMGVCCKPKASM